MESRLLTKQGGDILRLSRNNLAVRVLLQKILSYSLQGAAASYARYIDINFLTQLLCQFDCCRSIVHIGICRILELLRHIVIRGRGSNFQSLVHRAGNTQLRICQHELRSERADDFLSLLTHVLRHDNDHAIAFANTAERKPDSCISGSRLNDRHPGSQLSVFLRLLYHIECDPVFNTAARIQELRFGKNLKPGRLLQADERCVSDQIQNIRVIHISVFSLIIFILHRAVLVTQVWIHAHGNNRLHRALFYHKKINY